VDLKLTGLRLDLARQAFEQAREARLVILDRMAQAIAAPRAELSKYAPRITTLKINPEKIGAVIGPQGKVIKAIVESTGCQIDIEQDGSVHIFSANGEAAKSAVAQSKALSQMWRSASSIMARSLGLRNSAHLSSLLPGKDGLLHISEMADRRVNKVEDVMKMGDMVWVKVVGIDDRGRVQTPVVKSPWRRWTLLQPRSINVDHGNAQAAPHSVSV